ncbi:GDP-mannose-dependent alpha-(1-6)-phosphatidylinositol monomannoside mannosyltransferase [compost metagenome]
MVIHNGTPIIEASTSTQNSPYTGAKEIKNYLFAGRLDAAKGFDLLLSAMRRIDDKSIHLTVAGISSNEVHDSAKLDNINYLGWMKSEQLRPYFIHADALILPSRWEGFPMVVLEAMSLGIPVLASNCTSLSEAVDHGQTGLLFDTSDIDNISNALTAIDQNTLKQMGVKGRERFQKYFTSDIMTKSTISLYSKLKHNNGMRNLKGAV